MGEEPLLFLGETTSWSENGRKMPIYNLGLTERICQLAEFRDKVDPDLLSEADWREFKKVLPKDDQKEEVGKVQEIKKLEAKGLGDLNHIGEDIYLDFSKKTSLEQQCFACGDGDKIPIDGKIYGISALFIDDGKGEEFPAINLCPRHFADLAEQILLHVWRVGKGKEEGALKLPLLKWKGEDE